MSSEPSSWMPDGEESSGAKAKYRFRHRKPLDDDDDEDWSVMTRCGFSFALFTTLTLLWGALGLVLYWAINIQGGFAWDEDPRKQFNLHPVLMIAGFITFLGHALLTYRACRCCRRVFNKLVHTFFHLCTIACATLGVIAVFNNHNALGIKNLYSLHSWLGLITMGLFALQFVVGFFSFLILMCCNTRTASFRASLVPLHSTFGLVTFMLAIATAVTGITEKAIFELKDEYQMIFNLNNPASTQAIIFNTLGLILAALAIMVPFIIRNQSFASRVSEGDLIDERL